MNVSYTSPMSDILMTNIFFMITAISSITITVVLVIALIYLIKFIKKVTAISEAVETETLRVISDVEEVRTTVRENMTLVRGITNIALLKKIIKRIFTHKNK